ncbi:MAG TPA: maleylacetoacetate isomerase [Xanthobacteraceae bacterium]|jgi:maleylpyruvate isomerase|nr:maleylacetoacetate isomerase [Xanthobacteraceae bacterium]
MMRLYDYAFSNASVRTRIVMYLKGISFERVTVDLLNCKQLDGTSFLEINPQGMVPALIDGDMTLNQSLAIAEYLDEIYPDPRLLPADAKARARVRSLAFMVACDGQPIVNLRIRRFLRKNLRFSRSELIAWVQHWLQVSLGEYEATLTRSQSTGAFSYGDEPTIADVCLVPQVLLAKRFGVDLTSYAVLMKIHDHCMSIEAFQKAAAEYVLADPEFGLDNP